MSYTFFIIVGHKNSTQSKQRFLQNTVVRGTVYCVTGYRCDANVFGFWRASFSWASSHHTVLASEDNNNNTKQLVGFSILNTKQLQTVVDTSHLAPLSSCTTLLHSNHTMLLFSNMNASQMFVLLLSLCTFSIDALSTGAKQRTQTTTAAPTLLNPQPRPLSRKIQEAWERNIHPVETQEELGNGIFLTEDWRKAWFSYGDDDWIDAATGYANYEIDDIEGSLPADLVGTLYRNGPGKLGVNGQRVATPLDGDGVVLQITIPPPGKERKVQFQSRFVETRGFQDELQANQFIQRGTFGTGPMGSEPGKGINEDPNEPSLWTKR